MNKISLAGLVFGLMVLGSLFFVIGFLSAIATFGTGSTSTPPSWANINQAASDSQNAFGKLAGAIGGKLLHDQAIKLESKLGGGALAKVVHAVPPSLQPFAAQAQNHLALKAQQGISGLSANIQNGGFGPRRFGAAHYGNTPRYQPQSPLPAPAIPQRKVPPAFAPHPQQQQYAGQPLYRVSPQQQQQYTGQPLYHLPSQQQNIQDQQQSQQSPQRRILRPLPQQHGYYRQR